MTSAYARTLPRPGPGWGLVPHREDHDAAPLGRGLQWRTPARRAAHLAARAGMAEPRWAGMMASDAAQVPAASTGAPMPTAPWTAASASSAAQGVEAPSDPPRWPVFETALAALQARIRREGLTDPLVAEALAAVCACAERVLGLRPRPTQRRAAAALVEGRMAEMATGEGKTLAIGLAAAIGALAGMPVHVATANAYLAARDAATLAPLFQRLGLGVAALPADEDEAGRRAAYAQDVVYATAKDLAFDFLRDHMACGPAHASEHAAARLAGRSRPQPRQRGLCMAILDEADSLLLDEADVPLILARQAPHAARRAFLWQALALARQLILGSDFVVDARERSAQLTPRGEERVGALCSPLGGPWARPRYRREAVHVALAALHALRRNVDYLVREGRIEILDEVTGRAATGRQWSRGLHAVVALKEDLAAPPESEVMAQITFQRFFRRYWRLAGVSGTLREARGELHAVYGAAYVAIAPHAPSRRIALPPRRYADRAALDRALVERVQALHRAGRPVLIGTDGVDDSARVAEVLRACGLAPAVLDALHATEEALVVGRAGACGRVTVATRMAGRGTDIALDAAARAAGGLHVLCLQRNPSRRLDRQLAGRAARGGDPGSVETWWCDADESDDASRARERPLAARLAHFAWRLGQAREERRRAALRRELLRQDLDWNQRLSFTGRAT